MSKKVEIKETGKSGEVNEDVYHVPVLLQEAIDGLAINPDGIYVDCTMGGGGHARAILQKLGDAGRLILFDQDEAAIQNVPDDKRVLFIPQNFKHLQRFLKLHNFLRVDGILADLGVSSHQFDEADRGFSTRFDANLDMRMDKRQKLTAADILNTYTEAQLHKLFEKYGEVTNSKTLAKTIVAKRAVKSLATINEFKHAVHEIVKGNPNKYFAQVFQALRIEVNNEMGALKDLLEQGLTVLNKKGRLAIISFHSLEDRLVKNFFKTGSVDVVEEDDVYGGKPESPLEIVTRKPVTASPKELKINPRSRSAKLRIAEKK